SGFFSSNRRGNDDIYQFTRMAYTVDLKGLVVDAATQRPLPNSLVILRHLGRTDTLRTNSQGEFSRILAKEMDYEISGSRPSFVSKYSYFSTSGITVDSTIHVKVELNQVHDVQQWVMENCETLKKKFLMPNIYYDLDKSDIRPDARLVLDQIARIMQANPEI